MLSGHFPEGGPSTIKKILPICVALITFLIALGILLYPLISTWYNEQHQSQIQTQYQQMLEQADDTQILNARDHADAYNKAIRPGTQMTDSFSKDALLSASEDYDRQLNLTGDGIMGYIKIPSIRVELPIYHGTEDNTLEKGIGHLLGTSLPVGGESTHTVLTGHSGMASKKMFSDIVQLGIGDVFYLEVLGQTLAYQVDRIDTVLPYDTSLLGIREEQDLCTLVTCTPFGVNTHRLLVRGHRFPYVEAKKIVQETESMDIPMSKWEQEYIKGIWIGIAGVSGVGTIYWVVGLIRKKHLKKEVDAR